RIMPCCSGSRRRFWLWSCAPRWINSAKWSGPSTRTTCSTAFLADFALGSERSLASCFALATRQASAKQQARAHPSLQNRSSSYNSALARAAARSSMVLFKDEGWAMAFRLFLAKLLIRSGIARWLPLVRRWTDGGGAFLRYYSDRLLSAPHQAIRDAAVLFETPGPDTIDLSQGAPRFDLTPSTTTQLPAAPRGRPPPAGLPEPRAPVAETLLGPL